MSYMFEFGRRFAHQLNQCGCRNFCSSKTPPVRPKKYSDTLLLPKTKFPQKVVHSKRAAHEASIAANAGFDSLYENQREWRKDCPEFVLHDGPPYANGDVHIGHAVNKILKDITNRYKLLRNHRIHYVPGWDCHGLPIELKAMKDGLHSKQWTNDPRTIRQKAREVAKDSIAKQMGNFRRWGVMANWNEIYRTMDKEYIRSQLQFFHDLYEKGLVYRELKPVFWSPSSKTALAEAELEYESFHESVSLLLGIPLTLNVTEFCAAVGGSLPGEFKSSATAPVEAVIWTTTPWSLPSNAAIAYSENQEYVLLASKSPFGPKFYILAKECEARFKSETTNQVYTSVMQFPGSSLKSLRYKHPWFKDTECPFLPANYVTMEKGTGLVHTAPAHGSDDYLTGLKHKLPMTCFINEDGNFDSQIPELKGMPALSLGTTKVLKELKDQVIYSGKYLHAYPYDWRTKKPVIIRTSMQWFLNTEQIKSRCVEELENVAIHPPNVQHAMLSQLVSRPYWCISRQRVWGVPIPVLFHKDTGEPLVSREVIDRLCELVLKNGTMDFWWELPLEEILEDKDMARDYEKGKDIFDIWLDSGISWHILGDRPAADVYLEGVDQFTGWFQSSLLLSAALRQKSPYKSIYVHGFVVDDTGKKMSKSLGNVIDPQAITDGGKKGDYEPFGADVLRWWCATQGSSDAAKIAISVSLLKASDDSIQKLRNTLRFLVSFCTRDSIDELRIDEVSYDELMYVDQYMLTLLRNFQQLVTEDYENYNYHRIMNRTLHFVATEVSSQYLTWIKDRLYCDIRESSSRKSCIYVLNEIYLTLTKVLAPVLPYLCEEVHAHYTNGTESVYEDTWFEIENSWHNPSVASIMELALDLRTTINQMMGEKNSKTVWAEILCNEKAYQSLQMVHPTKVTSELDKCSSELCDILQLSGLDLKQSEEKKFSIESFGVGHSIAGYSVAIGKTEMHQCHRCRRFCCSEGSSLCTRCHSVLKRLEQPPPDEQVSKDSPPQAEAPAPERVKEEILLRSS